MNPYVILGIVLLWVASIAGTGVYEYRDGAAVTTAANDKQRIEENAKSAKLIAEKDALILQGGIEHAKNQTRINNLATQLADAKRVQVHIPVAQCGGDTKGSADPNGASGILSTGVDDAFAKLQDGVSRLVQRCDQLNIDAIASNTANR